MALKINTIHPGTPSISNSLTDWYTENYRLLPWRETNDPYKVWLSEIILQQTRVNQGLPYYEAFVSRFSDVESFANADLDEILKLWQGLGYYSRARNMHTCANTIINEYDQQFPTNYKELLKLKGVGKYTAAAIASICFDEAVPVVDGNVYRVFSRLFGIDDDISDAKTFKVFFEVGQQLIDSSRPGTFNQSVMELGALVCTPKNPDCINCPVAEFCHARAHGTQSNFPVKTKKVKVKQRSLQYYFFCDDQNVLVKQRGNDDIWKGLYEFYLVDSFKENIDTEHIKESEQVYEMKHILTHQRLEISFFAKKLSSVDLAIIQKDLGLSPVKIEEIRSLAVSKPIESFLNEWDFNYFT